MNCSFGDDRVVVYLWPSQWWGVFIGWAFCCMCVKDGSGIIRTDEKCLERDNPWAMISADRCSMAGSVVYSRQPPGANTDGAETTTFFHSAFATYAISLGTHSSQALLDVWSYGKMDIRSISPASLTFFRDNYKEYSVESPFTADGVVRMVLVALRLLASTKGLSGVCFCLQRFVNLQCGFIPLSSKWDCTL